MHPRTLRSKLSESRFSRDSWRRDSDLSRRFWRDPREMWRVFWQSFCLEQRKICNELSSSRSYAFPLHRDVRKREQLSALCALIAKLVSVHPQRRRFALEIPSIHSNPPNSPPRAPAG